MTPEVTIRPYQPSDQPGVEWLYARTPPWGRTYARPEPIPEAMHQIAEVCEISLVAVEQDRDGEAIVGFVGLTQPDSPGGVPLPGDIDSARRIGRLHWVLVAPERWRNGIGRRLVQEVLEWCRRNGFEAVILDTTTDQEGAVHFYRAIGFRELEHTRYRDWELAWFIIDL
jgi:GNAT superfamily N-acetyltransferase